jgi:phosphate transport system substrate-binding protein
MAVVLPWLALLGGAHAAMASASGGAASTAPKATPGQLVEWVVPAVATQEPQTEAEKEAARRSGRPLPPREALQPTLDPDLPAYVPTPGLRLSGSFRGAASDVLPDLVREWIRRFRAYHPGVELTIEPPFAGSLGAIELVKETLDFVAVSRELKPEDIAGFSGKFGYPPLSVPISGGSYRHFGFLDAMAIIVHKDNPLEKISLAQLDGIFSSTRHRGSPRIARWGDLGVQGKWADQPIHAHGIRPWNGFEEFMRQRVLNLGDKRGEWAPEVRFDPVVFPMAARIAADPAAIGYTGLAYLDAGVKVIPVMAAADAAPVAPSYENVALARYPLSRLIYFNTNKAPDQPLPPALGEFLRFILSREGQQVVLDQAIYLPLRSAQVRASRQMLDR